MGWVKDEKFEYYGDSLKNPIFMGGGSHEKPIYRVGLHFLNSKPSFHQCLRISILK